MSTEQPQDTLGIAARLARSRGRTSRDRMANARVTLDEQKELEHAAKTEGKALSEWAREVLLREARGNPRTDALFTEVIALRMMLDSFLRPLSCGQVITSDDFTAQMMSIRTTKQRTAKNVLQQYAATQTKER